MLPIHLDQATMHILLRKNAAVLELAIGILQKSLNNSMVGTLLIVGRALVYIVLAASELNAKQQPQPQQQQEMQ